MVQHFHSYVDPQKNRQQMFRQMPIFKYLWQAHCKSYKSRNDVTSNP